MKGRREGSEKEGIEKSVREKGGLTGCFGDCGVTESVSSHFA